MSYGPITHACRVFLSRHHLYPGNVTRALTALDEADGPFTLVNTGNRCVETLSAPSSGDWLSRQEGE